MEGRTGGNKVGSKEENTENTWCNLHLLF
jgi:hypothetical protein